MDKPRRYFAIRFKRQGTPAAEFFRHPADTPEAVAGRPGHQLRRRGSQPLRELARLCERPESTVPDGVLTATVNLPRNRGAVCLLSLDPSRRY
jgi:hypothetical protein